MDQVRTKIIPVSRSVVTITDRDAFERCTNLSLDWIAKTGKVGLARALAGSSFELADSDVASASALRFDDEHGSIWSAQVDFRGDKTAERRWVTDLFVDRRQGGVVRFGTQLNCHVTADDPGFEHSRPRLIQDILADLSCEADGEILNNDFSQVTHDNLDALVQLIYRPSRRLPILLVSVDDNGSAQVDLERLARRVSGTAHLRTVDIDTSFDLTRAVGKRMSTFNGAVRVYLPNLDDAADDPFLHPLWLAPHTGWNPRLVSAVSDRILPLGFRNLDGDAFWRLSLLRQATSRAEANAQKGSAEQQLRAEVSALSNECKEAHAAAQSAEALMDEEAAKYARAEATIAQLTEQNFSLRERLRNSGSADQRQSAALSQDDLYDVFDQNPTLETSLRIISSVFCDRVVVLESALESARDSYDFKHRKKAFELLWRLCTEYWNALSSGGGDAQAKACFGSAYAAREAATLSKSGRRRRTFPYKGEDIEMEKHLKIGVADNKSDTLRVHFEWVANDSAIVIGHCGGHLNF